MKGPHQFGRHTAKPPAATDETATQMIEQELGKAPHTFGFGADPFLSPDVVEDHKTRALEYFRARLSDLIESRGGDPRECDRVLLVVAKDRMGEPVARYLSIDGHEIEVANVTLVLDG